MDKFISESVFDKVRRNYVFDIDEYDFDIPYIKGFHTFKLNKKYFSYRVIEFHSEFNQPISQKFIEIFKNINAIYFWNNFNQPINKLPKHIQIISIYGDFNQSLDNLPENLVHLELGDENGFEVSLDNLPSNLKYLLMESSSFNGNLDNLPRRLKYYILDVTLINQLIIFLEILKN